MDPRRVVALALALLGVVLIATAPNSSPGCTGMDGMRPSCWPVFQSLATSLGALAIAAGIMLGALTFVPVRD